MTKRGYATRLARGGLNHPKSEEDQRHHPGDPQYDPGQEEWPLQAIPQRPRSWLGAGRFGRRHGVRFPFAGVQRDKKKKKVD